MELNHHFTVHHTPRQIRQQFCARSTYLCVLYTDFSFVEKGETTEDAEDTLAGDIGGMKGKKLLSVTGAFSRLSPCNLPHKQALGALSPDQSFDARPGNIEP